MANEQNSTPPPWTLVLLAAIGSGAGGFVGGSIDGKPSERIATLETTVADIAVQVARFREIQSICLERTARMDAELDECQRRTDSIERRSK